MKKIFLLIYIAIFYSANSANLWTEIEIPVRDGKLLKADLYTMDTSVAKPCILIQTPYNKLYYRNYKNLPPEAVAVNTLFDTVNYNFVIMDWRGFYANKDAADAKKNRGEDGYDAIEWMALQKWCNGKIGTSGSSALGMIQFQTAALHPPHLVCSAPFVKDFQTKYTDYYYGGDLLREHTEQLQNLGFLTVNAITSLPVYNNTWKFVENQSDLSSDIAVPMFLVSGWFDHFPTDVIRAFSDLQQNSDASVKNQHKLIMGPWSHSDLGKLKQGELEFPDAVDIPQNEMIDFFEYYLRGAKNGWLLKPAIRYFQMGSNLWKEISDWNIIRQQKTDTLFLRKNNLLSPVFPPPIMSPLAELPDTLLYNPRDPSPTIGGSRFDPFNPKTAIGPYDISGNVETRKDVLSYTTNVLENEIDITGKTEILLYASSDKTDTDFSVRLCDVFPDGKSYILTQGIVRGRFWKNFSEENLLVPNQIYQLKVELNDLSISFQKGHRLRIDITSSNYPMFDINPNSGGELYKTGDTLTATNVIFCNAEYPSRMVFTSSTLLSTEENIKQNPAINLFPNPANDYISIDYLNNQKSLLQVTILNILGEAVLNGNFQNTNRIDISFLRPGTYFVKINTGHEVLIKKFLKIMN